MKQIHIFSKKLEDELDVNVFYEPEYMTSIQASRMTEEAYIDASAATIILQSFLDKKAKAE